MAFSTQVITDTQTAATNGPSSTTTANAINPTPLTTAGGANNLTNGSGVYASSSLTYYAGEMDYPGMVQLAKLKMQEIAVLLAKVVVNTDLSTDATNNALLVKVLNVFQ